MRIYRARNTIPAEGRGASCALGNFDGVHRGHRMAIEMARAHAGDRLGGVVTFEPHPRAVIDPARPPKLLTPFRAKAQLLERAGCQAMFVLPFDAALMRMAPEDFVDRILIERLGLSCVVTGGDFRFGAKRRGDVALLAARLAAAGVRHVALPPVAFEGERVASSAIRSAIEEGRVDLAAERLRRYFEIEGVVRPGDGRGRRIGFPTANLEPLARGLVQPALGVYAALFALRERGAPARWRPAVVNWGMRPTFAGEELRIEAHLLDGGGDLYGERARLALVERIRPERRFEGIDALIAQIERDCEIARAIHRRIGHLAA